MRRQIESRSTFEDPPSDFCEWWNPSRRDKESGADVGGHPDAERVWARKDPGRWVYRTYGTSARVAWNAECYQSEYLRWVAIGRPEREDCVMIAASIDRQKQFWSGLKSVLSRIGKPTPEPEPFDYDAPTKGTRLEY